MAPTNNHVHVVFGTQERLEEALRLSGRDEAVVAFPDDLSIGPINCEGDEARVAGLVSEFGPGFASCSNLPAELEEFWRSLRSTEATPVIWFTRRSAREYSGFLALASALGEQPCQIVDFSGVDSVRRRYEQSLQMSIYLSLWEMPASKVAGFLGSEQTLSSEQRDRYREIWSKLRKENAALRVLTDGGLASEPASFFDDALLEATPTTWQLIARTIGTVWGMSWDDYVFQISELVLVSRIPALVALGSLECRGDPNDIRAGEIRRPAASSLSSARS